MAYQIKVSNEAERQLSIAQCFYKASSLDDLFNQDFLKLINSLEANPLVFRAYYRNVRRTYFDNFKYSIHYIVNKREVYILAILHHKQNP